MSESVFVIFFLDFLVIVPTFVTKVTAYLCSGWVIIFRKVMGFKDCHFGTIDARYISRY